MVLTEYNEVETLKHFKKEWNEEGEKKGEDKGITDTIKLLNHLKSIGKDDEVERVLADPEYAKKLLHSLGGASAVCEVMQRYEDQAVVAMLVSLVKDGLLAIKEAAARAHLTEEEFKARMETNS